MRFDQTVAARCRWASFAKPIIGDADVLWEKSEADYQGSANLLAKTADGKYILGGWSYGSCSGCDAWEDRPEEEVEASMKTCFNTLSSIQALANYYVMLVRMREDGDMERYWMISFEPAIKAELDKTPWFLDEALGAR